MARLWRWLRKWMFRCLRWVRLLFNGTTNRQNRKAMLCESSPAQRHPIQPKPKWVRDEVIRLKALMPQAGCRTIAHHFNRRWAVSKLMTVSKTYVAETCRRHQYLIYEARRKLKHRVPRPMPRNRIWGCDLLTKTDQEERAQLALAIVDHASRACLRLHQLADKSSLTLFCELIEAVKRYGRPMFLRTDNEAVFVSRVFRLGLWVLGIGHQRIEPGCPWQNGRVERFIGTVKRELRQEALTSSHEFDRRLTGIRQWYNHERPHDHLQGRTPAEVWGGIDIFMAKPG